MTAPRLQARGLALDAQTRCAHYASPRDIVALKLRCCRVYYASRECHDALAGHPAEVWRADERDAKAVLCGACGAELTIARYPASPDACPPCTAPFNPGCRTHHHLYFAPG